MKIWNAKMNLSHRNGSFELNENVIKIAFSAPYFRINSLCSVVEKSPMTFLSNNK